MAAATPALLEAAEFGLVRSGTLAARSTVGGKPQRHGRGHGEGERVLLEQQLTHQIIGAAIEVHRAIGPGLLESAYEHALCHELALRQVTFERQVDLSLFYKDAPVSGGYRVDLIVAGVVLVELKAVAELLPIHEAQLLTYLRISAIRVGLLLNFNVAMMRQGIVRRVL